MLLSQACTVPAVKLVLLLPFATFGRFHLCSWCDFGILNDSSEVPAGRCAGESPGGNTLKSAVWISWVIPSWVITTEVLREFPTLGLVPSWFI